MSTVPAMLALVTSSLLLAMSATAGGASATSLQNASVSASRLTPARALASAASSSSSAIRAGFNAYQLAGNDDGSTSAVGLPFAIDFYGHTYSSVFVNNNGNLTMTAPLSSYTPQSLNQLGQPMIAPYWSDVDTRVGPIVSYGYGTVNGHAAFAANWIGVGCFATNTSVSDTFQVVLISRPDLGYGQFDIEFNYGPLGWETGQASGGDGRCHGGSSARAGYTSGFGSSYELPGSGVNGGLLSTNTLTGLSRHSLNSSQVGRYLFGVRSGGRPPSPRMVALGDSYSAGVGTYSQDLAGDPCDRSSQAWPYLLSAQYPAAPRLSASSFFACSGDTTKQVLQGQAGETAQVQQLSSWVSANGSPSMVTITVGGDDLHFVDLLKGCFVYGAPECINDLNRKIAYLKGGGFTQTLRDTYNAIKTASNGAQLVVVGYPLLFPQPNFWNDLHGNAHCVWMDGNAAGVFAKFREGQQELDSVMSQAASQAGARFVNIDGALAGHELCTGDAWIDDLGLVNAARGQAGHPNLKGQTAMAGAVAGQLGLLAGNGAGAARMMTATRSKAAADVATKSALAPSRTATVRRNASTSAALAVSSAVSGATLNEPYNGFVWANGGVGPVTWAVTSGALPSGLSLDPSTGIISGIPTAAGSASFTVTATDSSSPAQSASASLVMSVGSPSTMTVAGTPRTGTVGLAYAYSPHVAGGVAPYSWAVTSGALPAGLSLDTSTGTITGTPTAAGTTHVTVTATDSTTSTVQTASSALSITVVAAGSALTFDHPLVGQGVQGMGYQGSASAHGGTGALIWSVTSGLLPAGLSLNSGSGAITGIPTGTGSSTFTVQVQDQSSPPVKATESLTITVAASATPSIAMSSLPDGAVGAQYSAMLAGTGGVAAYTWTVDSGALPDGLALDPATGTLTGVPTSAGAFTFDVAMSDSSTPVGQVANAQYTVNVQPDPGQTLTVVDTVTPGTGGTAYLASMIPSGGESPYSFSVTSGALPAGLTLDAQTGTISGTPTAVGSGSATVTVTDSSGTPQTVTDAIGFTVAAASALSISTSSLAHAAQNSAYGQAITASGGVGADTFAVSSGSLPDGLSLDPETGVIAGTPTTSGTSSITVTVTDSGSPNPQLASATLALTVDPALALTVPPIDLPDALQGIGYSQVIVASGGSEPYSWGVSSGALPDGLSLDPNTGLLVGIPTGSGTSTFTLAVTDASGQTTSKAATLIVRAAAPLMVTSGSLDAGLQGMPYYASLDSAGGSGPVTWTLRSGLLPEGLTLDAASGTISGTPTGFGIAHFTMEAVDSSTPAAQTTMRDFVLEIDPLVPAQISRLSPARGPSTGHTQITISGSGFTAATAVTFGTHPALDFEVLSDNQILATVPAQPISTQDVRITTPAGVSQVVAPDKYSYVAPPKPTVTGVTPRSGTTGGGDWVTVYGTGFWGASKVAFGSTSVPIANVVIYSATAMGVKTPVHAAGVNNVTVTTPGGTSAVVTADRYTFVKPPAPVVTQLSQTSGPSTGSYDIEISGENLTQASKVLFGATTAPSVNVWNSNTIEVTVPAHAAGAVDITVTTPGGVSSKTGADKFTFVQASKPVIQSLSQTSGSRNGGDSLAVFGSGFTGATKVTFGGTSAPRFTVESDNEILVTTPAHAPGAAAVSVVTQAGTSTGVPSDVFTYFAVAKPAIQSLSQNTGSRNGGDTIAIFGSGFSGATKVTVGGTTAPDFTVESDNEIVAVTPAHAVGTVPVAVVTASGTSSAVNGDKFTYRAVPKPAITEISPSYGSTLGGTSVVIRGSSFGGATKVTFGGAAATSFTVESDGEIVAVAPAHAAGNVAIAVTTPTGASAAVTADVYAFIAGA
jgi:lysophospholipase L1-like esterase